MEHPELSVKKVALIAGASGVIMGAIEHVQAQAVIGKLPVLGSLIKSLSNPTSSFWRRFTVATAGQIVEQNLQEGVQDITPYVVQDVVAALNQDVPGTDWKTEISRFKDSRLDTFMALLPLSLVGAGVGAFKESRAMTRALADPAAMFEYGIPRADAEAIAAAPADQRESMFQAAHANRTEATITEGLAAANERRAAAAAAANSPATPRLEQRGDSFHIIEPDGKISATFDNAEHAVTAMQDRLAWEANGNANAVRDLVAWYASKDTARKWEVNPNKQTLDMEKGATPETVAEQMKLAGYAAGVAPSQVQVFGSNVAEVKEGIFTSVSQIHQGATVSDVVHERTHDQAKLELASGAIKWADAEAAVRAWREGKGETSAEPMSQEQIHEGIAEMGVEYFMGNFRKIESLPPSVKGFLGRMAVFFKDVMRRAGDMLRLKKAGKLDADWEAFLARAVGLDENLVHNKATTAAAAELAGTSFSIANSERITAADSAAYLAAVESGDMETARALVDKAAKAAGYEPRVLYHNTNASRGQLSEGIRLPAFVTTDAELFSSKGENKFTVYVNRGNEFRPSTRSETPAPELIAQGYKRQSAFDTVTNWTGKVIRIDGSPSQIKSADTITRDDAGNVIPLEKRFDSKTDNINFSLAQYEGADQPIPENAKVWNKPPVLVTTIPAPAQFDGRLSELAKKAIATVKGIFSQYEAQGGIPNPDVGPVTATGKGIGRALHLGEHNQLRHHIEAAGVIDQLIKNAVLVVSHDPSKGAIETDSLLKKLHRLVAPLQVGERLFRVKLTVKEFEGDARKYYDHNLTEIEYLKTTQASGEAGLTSGGAGSLPVSEATPQHRINVRDLLAGVKFGELSSWPMVNPNFSIAPASYADDLARRMDALQRDPEARLNIYARAKAKLAEAVKRSREQDAGIRANQAAAQSVEIEKEAIQQGLDEKLAELDTAKSAEIAVMGTENTAKFQDRIDAARTDAQRAALTREAKAIDRKLLFFAHRATA